MMGWYIVRTYKVVTKSGIAGKAVSISEEGTETEEQSRSKMTEFKRKYTPDLERLEFVEESRQFRR